MFEAKRIIRTKMHAVRDSYNKAWLSDKSAVICRHILDSPQYQMSKNIFGYLSFGNEVDIDKVLETAVKDGKNVYVPYIVPEEKGIMCPVKFRSFADVVYGKYDIRTVKEPLEFIKPDDIDLVLASGLCFSKNGARMGLGGGFYDKFLQTANNATVIGITFTPQIIDGIPMAEHDRYVDALVTEEGFFDCQTGK